MTLLGDERALARLSHAEKQRVRDRLAETVARLGLPVPTVHSSDTPGDLVNKLEPTVHLQRDHLRRIDQELRWVHDTPDACLIIETPPQVGKSWRVSRAFPFWWWTHNPTDPILLGCYALSLARRHALATRWLVENHGAKFGLLPGREEWTSTDFTMLSGGSFRARGIGGGLTGFPGKLGLVDDPHKDRASADSPVQRDNVWNWYSSVLVTRLAPGARKIVTMTRWHPDDLVGRLLAREGRLDEGGRWKVLHMPAIAQAPDPKRGFGVDPLGREPGQPLSHPAIPEGDTRALLKYWALKKSEVTIRDWDSMFQGSPYRSEGTTLTEEDVRNRTRPAPPHSAFRRTGVGIDPSGGGRDNAGLVAGGLDTDRKLWWTHDWSGVMSSGEWADKACVLAALVDADCFVIELNYGGDQATTLVRRAWAAQLAAGNLIGPDGQPLRDNAPCPRLIGVHSRKNKVLRAEPIAQAVKLGHAWFAADQWDGVGDPPADDLHSFKSSWTLWEPDTTWSPGDLDAGVHLAYELLPPPGAQASVTSVAKQDRSQVKGGAVANRRISR